MTYPRLARLQLGRLLPPAAGLDDVRAAVAVDVADAHAVREFLERLSLGEIGWKTHRSFGRAGSQVA